MYCTPHQQIFDGAVCANFKRGTRRMAITLKQLAADPKKDIKKADLYKVALALLEEEPGFNLRNPNDPEVKAHIEGLAKAYANGLYVPPLQVRARDDGKVLVVDGHCRRRAALKAVKELGASIEYLECFNFRGSDAERVEVMLRASEGLKLSPLEQAMGYLRLHRMGLDNPEIALRVNRTAARVEQLLLLANADSNVHALVRAGTVTADAAIEAVREHGEGAGAVLQTKVGEAKEAGKTKVTRGVLRGPALPPKVVSSVVGSLEGVLRTLDSRTRKTLATYERLDSKALRGKKVQVDASAFLELVRAQGAIDDARRKSDEKTERRRFKEAQGKLDIA